MLFPSDLASFLDLIRQSGDAAYSFMFAYAASHSLLLGLFAGDAAHSGAFALAAFPRFAGTAQTTARLTDKHYVWMIMVHRFPHGISGFAAIAYGMSNLPWSTFLALNFVAAGFWSSAVVLAGYAFGQVSEKLMSDASSGLGVVMLVVFLGLSFYLSRQLERAIERS